MSVTVEPPSVESPDAGVIKDARARQRQQWRRTAIVGTAAIVIGIGLYIGVIARAGAVRKATSDKGAAVISVATPTRDLRVTPSLWPGAVGLCVGTVDGSDSGTTCDLPYPGPGIPVINAAGLPGALVERPRPVGAEPVYLVTAPNVATVKIGDTTLTPRTHVGLPPGDRMLAVRIPTAPPSRPRAAPEIAITAFDRDGRVLPLLPRYREPIQSSFKIVALHSLAIAPDARCALSDSVPGYTDHPDLTTERVAGDPTAPGDAFFSCTSSVYVHNPGSHYAIAFYAAILLDGRHPGSRPGALWDATAVPDHPGVVENNAPAAVANSDTFLDGSLIARRDGNAWLVASTQSGRPTLAQRVAFIDALSITRLNMGGK